jgi:3-phenylpropionate/cinnamic acid dioxygenase small subunit
MYGEVVGFLYEEADLLDRQDFEAWLSLMTPDVRYTMPVRQSVGREAGLGINRQYHHFDETYGSLSVRVKRAEGTAAWAEDPPSRTRRFVTNIRVREDVSGDLLVDSYLLLLRYRDVLPKVDVLSCSRADVLRRDGEELRLAKREIVIDHCTVGSVNLAVLF